MAMSYPGSWQGGKRVKPYYYECMGYKYYRVTLTRPNVPKEERIKLFSWNKKNAYSTEEDAYAAANQYVLDMYHKYDLWKNAFRYLSADVIEVKLTQDKTMLIDAKDLHFVEAHIWWAERCRDIYYATTRNPDTATLMKFHRLITGFDGTIDHINKNALDNRHENFKRIHSEKTRKRKRNNKNKSNL